MKGAGPTARPIADHVHPAIRVLRDLRDAAGMSRSQWCAKYHRLVAVPIEEVEVRG